MARINDGESPAAFCRRMGWGPGTVITYVSHLPGLAVRITAVGEAQVLGVNDAAVGVHRWEGIRVLDYFDWFEVPAPAVTLMQLAELAAGKDGAPC